MLTQNTEILKQPLETAIAVHIEDFEDFHAEEDMHVVISVKDFKAIVTHAETLKGSLSAHFSRPSRPLQFSYYAYGMHCEFTLMTSGDHPGVNAAATSTPRVMSTRSSSRLASKAPSQATEDPVEYPVTEMAPPVRPLVKGSLSQRRTMSSLSRDQPLGPSQSDPDPESLFVPRGDDDDDRRWDPPDYENEEAEEMLGWDASADNVSVAV